MIFPSSSPLVVMMQATQNRNALEARQGWSHGWRCIRWNGNLSVDALMGTCSVEVPNVGLDLAMQMPIAENQDMVQQFTLDAANETLAVRVGLGCFDGRMDHINASALGNAFELVIKLAIVVTNEKTRSFTKRCGFAQLLGLPRHHSVNV
jgi:hypothetical protein